jgi:hypothetical protein
MALEEDSFFDPPPRRNDSDFSSLLADEDGFGSGTADGGSEASPAQFRAMRMGSGGGKPDSAADADDDIDTDRPSKRGAVLRWAALGLLLGGLTGGLVLGRTALLAAWPPASAFYALFGQGIEPLGAGLSLPTDRIRLEQRLVEGNGLLFVSGEVVNVSEQERMVPDIRAEARSATGDVLFSWTIEPEPRRLFKGQNASFTSQAPETNGQTATVTFTFVEPPPVEPAADGTTETTPPEKPAASQ